MCQTLYTVHSYKASAITMGAIQGFESVTFYLADPDPLAKNPPKITIKIKKSKQEIYKPFFFKT